MGVGGIDIDKAEEIDVDAEEDEEDDDDEEEEEEEEKGGCIMLEE